MVIRPRVRQRPKTVAVVQCTASDLYDSKDPRDYSIGALKESGLFHKVVLAMPRTDRAAHIDRLAEQWGVELYYGEEFNIARRIVDAVSPYRPSVVARVLLKRFYIDLELVEQMIDIVASGFDYVSLDRDVNYEVAADLMSFEALKQTASYLDRLPEGFDSSVRKFSPWLFMEESGMFKVYRLTYRKMWPTERIRKTKQKLARLTGAEENKYAPTIDNPASRYRFVEAFIHPTDSVLDIACGRGDGTALLAQVAHRVYGVDYNQAYIEQARKRHGRSVEFIHGTDCVLDELKSTFHTIVSLHTMEHIDEDGAFLERINRRLRRGGTFILEVPRLMPYPLGEPLYPCHKREYRRDSLETLLKETGFEIVRVLGGNRGAYVDVSMAREVLFYLCGKV